jgi:hypothetical protein|nr:hypothetical protein [Marinobacter sp.]
MDGFVWNTEMYDAGKLGAVKCDGRLIVGANDAPSMIKQGFPCISQPKHPSLHPLHQSLIKLLF